MRFWAWAVAAYARPGVADTCLALQYQHGQNTCLLLWAVWRRSADPVLAARAADLARAVDAAAIAPLRSARRGLKAPLATVGEAARERLREQVKAAELAAERLLIDALENLSGEAGEHASALEALQIAVSAWGRPAPQSVVADLAALID